MTKQFYAKSKVKNEDVIFCSFDIETIGLGGTVACCSYSTPTKTDIFLGENSLFEWFDKIFLSHPFPCIHYAHFASYEWRYLIPWLLTNKTNDYKISFNLRTETEIYQIVIEHEKTKYIMRDSYAIYPDTLKNFSKFFSPESQKLKLDFTKEKFNPENPDHVAYAIQDSRTLRNSLINYSDSINKLFSVSLGHTVAGTAIRAWQSTLDDKTIISYSRDGENEQFIRRAYYGGIVFLTSTEKQENCVTYDINSSYPYVMETYDMPYGTPVRTLDYVPGRIAIYSVKLSAPENLIIPIVPLKDAKGATRWTSGEFETVITNYELEFAIKNGYEIVEFYEGLYWPEKISPFSDFVNMCKQIRKQHKGTSYEKIAKLMQNSTYGKFGAKREKRSLIVGHENVTDGSDFCLFSPEYDDLFVINEYAEDMPCKPEWAVFITAIARLRIISTAYKAGVEHVLYGDTDSLTLTANADFNAIDIGEEYGQFKLEKKWRYFRALAPKTYAGAVENNDGSLEWKGAGKGLTKKSMTQEKFRELYENGMIEVEYETIDSLHVSLKKGLSPSRIATRKSSDINKSVNFSCENNKIMLKSAYV